MELVGKIKLINPTQEVSPSFRKRELVITTEEQYPQHILIEFTQMKVDDLNQFQVGEQVKVSINIRGREWVNPQGEAKYFNSIQGWRIERLVAQQAAAPAAPAYATQTAPPAQPFEPAPSFNEEEHDDLPF